MSSSLGSHRLMRAWYRAMLVVLSSRDRAELGGEMEAVFAVNLEHERQRRGRWGVRREWWVGRSCREANAGGEKPNGPGESPRGRSVGRRNYFDWIWMLPPPRMVASAAVSGDSILLSYTTTEPLVILMRNESGFFAPVTASPSFAVTRKL